MRMMVIGNQRLLSLFLGLFLLLFLECESSRAADGAVLKNRNIIRAAWVHIDHFDSFDLDNRDSFEVIAEVIYHALNGYVQYKHGPIIRSQQMDDYEESFDEPSPPRVNERDTAFDISGFIYFIFLCWMVVDSLRRYGLSFWTFVILIFQPLGPVIYFAMHYRSIIFRTGGGAPFTTSVNARIKKVRQQLSVADTLAGRMDLMKLLLEANQFEACEKECKTILEEDAGSHEALYTLAMCRMAAKEFVPALELLKKILDEDPKYRFGKASMTYAEALWKAGRKEDALDVSKKNARAYPRPLTEYFYAKLLIEANQDDKAKAVLEDMIATAHMAPKEDKSWVRKGRSLLRSVR